MHMIAVGMAASFVPHNLRTTVDAIVKLVDNPEISHEDLLEVIGGPDFPTGGTVINKAELLEGYKTGRGRVRLRANFRKDKVGSRDKLVFYNIPYMTRKNKIMEDMVKAVNAGTVEGVVDIRDESAEDMALVVEIARGHDPDIVVEALFSATQLEHTYSLNNTCLVDGKPETLSLKELLIHYISFQQEVITRRTIYDLKIIDKRLNVVKGLLIALEDLDQTIRLIRESDSTAIARERLVSELGVNELQSNAILSMRMSSLTKLESSSLRKELQELSKRHELLSEILNDDNKLNEVFIQELREVAKPFFSERRTTIKQVDLEAMRKERQEIEKQELNIGIDYEYNVAIMTDRQFTHQANLDKNMVMFTATTDCVIRLLASDGLVYRIPLDQVRDGDNLIRLAQLNSGHSIVKVFTPDDGGSLVITTKQGMIKKTCVQEYVKIGRNKTIGIKLRDGDLVINAECHYDDESIVLATSSGQAIRFDVKELNNTGRNTLGVKAISLKEGDCVVSSSKLLDQSEFILVLTEEGDVKKIALDEINKQGRGGKGVHIIDLNSTDSVVFVGGLSKENSILLFKGSRVEVISLEGVRVTKRGTKGRNMSEGEGITRAHLKNS